jgi:hypothetical protein
MFFGNIVWLLLDIAPLTTSMSALPSLGVAFIHACFVALYYVVHMHALRIRFLPYPSCCLPLGGCRNLKGKWGNIIRKFVGTLFIYGLVWKILLIMCFSVWHYKFINLSMRHRTMSIGQFFWVFFSTDTVWCLTDKFINL